MPFARRHELPASGQTAWPSNKLAGNAAVPVAPPQVGWLGNEGKPIVRSVKFFFIPNEQWLYL